MFFVCHFFSFPSAVFFKSNAASPFVTGYAESLFHYEVLQRFGGKKLQFQ
ncbi:hypothetical protein D932_00888 [Enterococcus casseliflavus 14-MB-W-14]|nr:hypothetical protein D932_00888 [Enterococcus casseliflavus 14-MB-W-14]